MAANWLTHLAEATARRKTTFMNRWEREYVVRASKGDLVRKQSTRLVPWRV